jgi:RNA polymerase sigma-70 factor (ECF subfamily)
LNVSHSHQEFLALLQPAYDGLARYARALTGNAELAEDLVSDTVLIALQDFGMLRDRDRFLPYLMRIASRLHKRRRYRERMRMPFREAEAVRQPDSSPAPDRAAEIRIVLDALAQLPDRVQQTVLLFDVADLSLEEVRQVQGGTLSGVKSRLRRGREQLSKSLGVEPPDLESSAAVNRRDTRTSSASTPLTTTLIQAHV